MKIGMKNSNQNINYIPLYRSGETVTSLISSFGYSLKETRLTAILGYLIALNPEPFIKIFKFKGEILSITLENSHDLKRSDILLTTTKGTGIIEAKVDTTDPFKQSMRYKANWKVLLTQYLPTEKQRRLKNIAYFQWKHIVEILENCTKNKDYRVKFVSNDLLHYLKEHRMIKDKESIEIYAREINSKETIDLFLRGRMYGCSYEKSSKLAEALYFAPHFGQHIASLLPGIKTGISYIAQIEDIVVVESWKDLEESILAIRKKTWLNSHWKLIKSIQKDWNLSQKNRGSFIFLGEPRLVFNPAVKKDDLQKGKGWLSKKYLTFESLFKAWGC